MKSRPFSLNEAISAFGGTVLTIIVTVLVFWNSMSTALAVVESRVDNTERQLNLIVTKFDKIDDKLDDIIVKIENKKDRDK